MAKVNTPKLEEGWELFTGRHTRYEQEAMVSIQTRGNMSLNAAAWKALGRPEAVELLWNESQRLVGIRAADPQAEHAYALRSVERATTHILSFIAFAQTYGIPIDTEAARRYAAEVRDNMLIIDLKKAPMEVKNPRYGKPRPPRRNEQHPTAPS
jgi:hypothetical protein